MLRAGQNSFRTVQWGRNGCSTEVMTMSRHRCGEYRTQAWEVPLSTLFGAHSRSLVTLWACFFHHIRFLVSCFTPLPATNGFSQAGPVFLVWWLTCPMDAALWQLPVAPQCITVTPNHCSLRREPTNELHLNHICILIRECLGGY